MMFKSDTGFRVECLVSPLIVQAITQDGEKLKTMLRVYDLLNGVNWKRVFRVWPVHQDK